MELGSRNVEWILVAVLIISTLAVFLFVSAGMMQAAPQSTITNMILVMVFGGEMLLGIILLRLYDKLSSVLELMEKK